MFHSTYDIVQIQDDSSKHFLSISNLQLSSWFKVALQLSKDLFINDLGLRQGKGHSYKNILTRCNWTTVSIWLKPGHSQRAKWNWKDIAVAAFLIFAGPLCSWRDIVLALPGGGGDISNWLHDTLQWKQLSEKLNQRGLAPPARPLIYKSAGR